jgi:hypothetical protein
MRVNPNVRTFRAITTGVLLLGASIGAVAITAPAEAGGTGALQARTTTLPNRSPLSDRELSSRIASRATVTAYSSSIVAYDGHTYSYRIVGKNPAVHQTSPTTSVRVTIIPTIVTFTASGNVYDPTSTACSDGATPVSRTVNSPIFHTHAYSPGGVNVGTVQYTDMLQRSQFWNFVKPGAVNPNYHLTLTSGSGGTLHVNVTGFPESGTGCSRLGEIGINEWDSLLRSVMSNPTAHGLTGIVPTRLPLFLVHNVVFTQNGCCILGYHSATGSQTYSTVDYDTTGRFGTSARDVSILSHEVAEWADDPFVNNATPRWGHVGQVSGCQGNLENGDPLTGHTQTVKLGGFTYHPQELAFFGWFYGPDQGVAHRFSTNGTFTRHSTPCT